jgi:hypothetical protein
MSTILFVDGGIFPLKTLSRQYLAGYGCVLLSGQ